MSALQRQAVAQFIDQADELGVPVPQRVQDIVCGGAWNGGALLWEQAHPADQEVRGCCWGEVERGGSACTCWTPVYDVAQQVPTAVTGPYEAAAERCADCAFRPGSPELSEDYMAETLLGLAARGERFWCHQGMRRPLTWQHPDGRTIAGDPADWQPPIDRTTGVPFRADGRPGLLCAGWAGQAAAVARQAAP